jgi:hypothetical protein
VSFPRLEGGCSIHSSYFSTVAANNAAGMSSDSSEIIADTRRRLTVYTRCDLVGRRRTRFTPAANGKLLLAHL